MTSVKCPFSFCVLNHKSVAIKLLLLRHFETGFFIFSRAMSYSNIVYNLPFRRDEAQLCESDVFDVHK